MKKGSKLYSYLEATGVLSSGNREDIARAKKQYWILVRKEWQKQKRKECKSYTVFFTPSEHKALTYALKGSRRSVTAFIKQSALQVARNSSGVDKMTVGQVREAFFETYNSIKALDTATKEKHLSEALERFINLEQKILNLLCS
jgi:hypothetical protein